MINYLYNKSSSLDKNTNISIYARQKYEQYSISTLEKNTHSII